MCLLPSVPTPPPAPEPKAPVRRAEVNTNAAAIDAREEERRRLSRRKGYESTMLTGRGGLSRGEQSAGPGKMLLGQ